MYSDKDFQTFWFRYKTEGEPHGISINEKLKWTLTPIALKMLGDEYGSENLISNGIVNIIEL